MAVPRIHRKFDSALTDTKIVERILSGEKDLYEILMRRNNQTIYRIIRSYLRDENDIEDVMQITYIKAYENLTRFKFESKFSTWLISIGIRECLAILKKKGRHHSMYPTAERISSPKILNMTDAHQINPEKAIIRKEAQVLLEHAIDDLPEDYRAIYMLGEVEKMSMREISDATGLTLSNAKVKLHRSRHMLKNNLYHLSSSAEVFQFGNSRCDLLVETVLKTIKQEP